MDQLEVQTESKRDTQEEKMIIEEPGVPPTIADAILQGEEEWISLKFTHSGKEFTLSMEKSDRYESSLYSTAMPCACNFNHGLFRVFDLKSTLFDLTNVPPERQKVCQVENRIRYS